MNPPGPAFPDHPVLSKGQGSIETVREHDRPPLLRKHGRGDKSDERE